MQLRTWLYLKDIVKFGTIAIELRGDMSREEVIADDRTYFAVERLLFIVGEAVNTAVLRESEVADLLTDTNLIRRFRNLLAHGYFKVNREQVVGILFDNLELLISEAAGVPQPIDDSDEPAS
jgi:uncharacterized protein with HEPN domain